MIAHSSLIRFALVFLFGLLPVAAQELKLRTLSLGKTELPEFFLTSGEDRVELTFSPIQPAPPVEASYVNPLPLYRSSGQDGYQVAQKVKLPTGAREILLLGWVSGKDQIRFVALEDKITGVRYNDWLLINASGKEVAFKMGDQAKPVTLAPGKSQLSKISAPRDEGAAVEAHAKIGGKWKKIYSTYWPVRGDRRGLVLFTDDGREVRVKRIVDMLAQE